MIKFKNYFFGLLPVDFLLRDTYKELDPTPEIINNTTRNRGLLERYLELFGEDIDESLIPMIEQIIDIIDPLTYRNGSNPELLRLLNANYGMTPDVGNQRHQSDLLQAIMGILSMRGTFLGLKRFFRVLGFYVNYSPLPGGGVYRYDMGATEEDPPIEYDSGAFYDVISKEDQELTITIWRLKEEFDIYNQPIPLPADVLKRYIAICNDFLLPANLRMTRIVQSYETSYDPITGKYTLGYVTSLTI